MRNSRQGSIPSEIGGLIDELDDIQRRLRILEAPSGEALENTVPKLSALVSDLQAQIEAWVAGRRTDAATDTIIDAKIAAAIAAVLGGNVSIAGNLSVAGAIGGASLSTGGSLTAGGAVTMPNVYNTNIVGLGGSRKTVWVGGGGRLGVTA